MLISSRSCIARPVASKIVASVAAWFAWKREICLRLNYCWQIRISESGVVFLRQKVNVINYTVTARPEMLNPATRGGHKSRHTSCRTFEFGFSKCHRTDRLTRETQIIASQMHRKTHHRNTASYFSIWRAEHEPLKTNARAFMNLLSTREAIKFQCHAEQTQNAARCIAQHRISGLLRCINTENFDSTETRECHYTVIISRRGFSRLCGTKCEFTFLDFAARPKSGRARGDDRHLVTPL